VEHRAWLAAFESFLQGKRHAPPSLDPLQCRFGAWLDAEKQAGRGELLAYQLIDAAHGKFHELAAAILTSQAQGGSLDGLGRLGELHEICEGFMAQLETFRQG
jgi:hypothetical protein